MVEVLTSVATQVIDGYVGANSSFCYFVTYIVGRDCDIYNQKLKKNYE